MQFFDLFTGGALSQLTIFALGIMPYISASIILELLTVAVPHLGASEKGRGFGAQEDQPVHALRHGLSLDGAGFRHRHRHRADVRSHGSARGTGSGLGIPVDDGSHAGGGYFVHHVARRANHRARHRQRHLPHHIRRHRRRSSRRDHQHVPSAGHRRITAFRDDRAGGGNGGRRGPRGLVRGRDSAGSEFNTQSGWWAGKWRAARRRTCP